MARAGPGSLCPPSPSSGVDSAASYTKRSISFMRKVSGGGGQGGRGAQERRESRVLALTRSWPLPVPLSCLRHHSGAASPPAPYPSTPPQEPASPRASRLSLVHRSF